MRMNLDNQKAEHETKIKSITNSHEKEVNGMKKQIKDTKKELETVCAEKAQQKFDNENEIKIQLTNLQRELEEKHSKEEKEKIYWLTKEFEMKLQRQENEHEKQIERQKFQTTNEEAKVTRANNLNFELGML